MYIEKYISNGKDRYLIDKKELNDIDVDSRFNLNVKGIWKTEFSGKISEYNRTGRVYFWVYIPARDAKKLEKLGMIVKKVNNKKYAIKVGISRTLYKINHIHINCFDDRICITTHDIALLDEMKKYKITNLVVKAFNCETMASLFGITIYMAYLDDMTIEYDGTLEDLNILAAKYITKKEDNNG